MRRMAASVLALSFATVGCEKQSAVAERQAGIVERTGDTVATCEAKRHVAQAYLAENDERNYATAHTAAEAYCLNEKLKADLGLGSTIPAGDDLTNAPPH